MTSDSSSVPTLYLLLDANVLAGYYAPQTLNKNAAAAADRIASIVDSVRNGCSSHIRLLTPEVCVAEAQTVLSKHANPKWKGGKKKSDDVQAIHGKAYKNLIKKMTVDLHGGRLIESIPLQRYHVLAKHLIAPVDHRTVLRLPGGALVRNDLGGTDQLICGMAIWLCRFLGESRIALITTDYRMWRVMQKMKKLKPKQAASLGLVETAEQRIGCGWSTSLVPQAVHLARASDNELRKLLGSWPLPTKSTKTNKQGSNPTAREVDRLVTLYQAMGTGRDRLPYTPAMTRLTKQFNKATGHTFSESQTWEILIGRLKKGKGRVIKH